MVLQSLETTTRILWGKQLISFLLDVMALFWQFGHNDTVGKKRLDFWLSPMIIIGLKHFSLSSSDYPVALRNSNSMFWFNRFESILTLIFLEYFFQFNFSK